MMDVCWVRTIALACVIGTAAIPSAWADDCDSVSTQGGLNICAGRAFETADAELNTAYGQLVARLAGQPDIRKLLAAAERSWVAFRDRECDFMASGVQGGSVQPMIYSMCLTSLTKARLQDLRGYLTCKEGDLSCPSWAR